MDEPRLLGATITQSTALKGFSDSATQNALDLYNIVPFCPIVSVPLSGMVDEAAIASAIEQAIDEGAWVICVNLAVPTVSRDRRPTEVLDRALVRAERAGVLLVATTGNHGQYALTLPAAFETVVAVGALDDAGEKAAKRSSWGGGFGTRRVLAPCDRYDVTAASTLVAGLCAAHLCLRLKRRNGGPVLTSATRSRLTSTAVGSRLNIAAMFLGLD